MPVIIRELIIRAEVNDTPAAGSSNNSAGAGTQQASADREALIQDCVEQVLEIIEKKKDR